MEVTLYCEMSLDGFIATSSHDTEWVFNLNTGEFDKFFSSRDVVIMGKQTYLFAEEDGDFPYKGPYNVVVTSNPELLAKGETEKYLFTKGTLQEILKKLERKGFNKVGIVGGGKLNGSFLKEGLIQNFVIIIHPVILGKGIKIFENVEKFTNLKLIDIEKLNDKSFKVQYQLQN